jgi:hypothetical protein
MARTSRTPAKPAAPEAEAVPVNPRTLKSQEKLAQAMELIGKELESGEWVSSNAIHKKLSGKISEGMFGRAKSALNVQHRRVKPAGGGRAEYEWALLKK